MPRLFWKLFGAFWLTTVAILAVSIFASFRLADRALDDHLDPREADGLVRQRLEEGGLGGVRQWLSGDNAFPPGQTIYLLDEDGLDLLDRQLPQFLERRARHLWTIAHRRAAGQSAGRAGRRFAATLHEVEGRYFLAMPGPAPLPRFGVLSTAGMRWTVLILAAVISLVSFWWLSRSLSRPVLRISDAAARLAGGDMAARVGAAGATKDEIGELATQFDRMAAQIESQTARRRELFRNISHELRAPLARLQIASGLLERKPQEQETQLARIRQEVDALDKLTAQVLDLARAEQGFGAPEPLGVAPLLDRIAADANYEAQAGDVTVRYRAPQGDVSVHADPALLASAIENVVRNAVQLTPAGGMVEIDCELAATECRVHVRDGGPGVAAENLERIFEPFYRLDQNRPGSGIGLAITARVLAEIGGHVVAANRDGGGLQVTLTIPVTG